MNVSINILYNSLIKKKACDENGLFGKVASQTLVITCVELFDNHTCYN